MKKLLLLICVFACSLSSVNAQKAFSVGGFYELKNSGREVYNFNVGWRYHKGDVQNAERIEFDDSKWDVVSTPHTVELMPAEASGGKNYQGVAWYRKHFNIDQKFAGKRLFIHIEAVMGKSKIYVNGKLVKEQFGGYLPVVIELTDLGVKAGEKCVIAVMADNSNDRTYAPGKPQRTLDFTYHGGMYRDVWLIATSPIHITDANMADKAAGGGVFVHYNSISKKQADLGIDTDVANTTSKQQTMKVETAILDADGKIVGKTSSNITLKAGESKQVKQKIAIKNPKLWHPDKPYLYNVESKVAQGKSVVDGVVTRIGIRKVEFKGVDGFYLNDEYFNDKLMGGNRHQDYAYVGNALPNSKQWQDAKKLRDAGMKVVRVAHYPQDPSFMDACDELGIFVIVATPGWQYWNKRDSIFEQRVYSDVRNMVRRDRNHPCVLMWEPVLNETGYPLQFSMNAKKIVKEEEYPYMGNFITADIHSAGVKENYDVMYGWPKDTANTEKCIFTREFGSNPDDWYAQNANNRASRSWGERPQILQALQLARSYNEMYNSPRQFVGGAHWHPFDHQRGYHPDPFWGGIMDAFRQPKYSYYMFQSQMSAKSSKPMVFVAHEITPFSDADVVVFTNCDEVRLIAHGRDTLIQKVDRVERGIPNPPLVFKNVFDFKDVRHYSYVQKNWQQIDFVVEGIINGEVVVSEKKVPARRSNKISLRLDNENQPLVADGSDFTTVIAEITDDNGNVRRLAKENIFFTIEGEGTIIGNNAIGANPRAVEFGSAPLLVRSTLNAGEIKVIARLLYEGENTPTPDTIVFKSIPSLLPLVYLDTPNEEQGDIDVTGSAKEQTFSEEEKQKMLMEVEQQQTEFGVKKKE